jgi:uncharacterized protein YegJ (DUF2314 family)
VDILEGNPCGLPFLFHTVILVPYYYLMKNKHLLIITAFVATLAACNNAKKEQKQQDTTTVHKMVELKTDDEKFLELKTVAQKELPRFLDSLKAYAADSNYRFIIKSDYAEGDKHEHMWSVVYNYNNGAFESIFADSAYYLKSFKMGDKVKVKKEDVEDWAIYDNKRNTETGNFSDKYLRSKM